LDDDLTSLLAKRTANLLEFGGYLLHLLHKDQFGLVVVSMQLQPDKQNKLSRIRRKEAQNWTISCNFLY
jgi:hypothetical protein